MTIAKPAGSVDTSDAGLDLDILGEAYFIFTKVAPTQPENWKSGQIDVPVGYVPKYAVCLTNSASNADDIELGYRESNNETLEECIQNRAYGASPLYTTGWVPEVESNGHTSGDVIQVGNFSLLPISLEPHTQRVFVKVTPATPGAGTVTKIHGFYCEHIPDQDYDDGVYRLTSRETAHWTPYNENESCSSIDMKYYVADNLNCIAYNTRQVWSFVL